MKLFIRRNVSLKSKFYPTYSFETSDGISRDEQGELVDVGTDDEAIQVRGSFTFTGQDGVVYTVTYTAGKEGFVPSGAHIPQA